jgi:hypothetical protein
LRGGAGSISGIGYRSVRHLGNDTINGMNARAYLEGLIAQEEAGGIAPALVEEQRLEARAAVAAQDVHRLRAKGSPLARMTPSPKR